MMSYEFPLLISRFKNVMISSRINRTGLSFKFEEEIFSCIYGNGKVNISHMNYLSNLTEQLEETLRIENITYFITSVLPEFDLNWHHLEWGESVQVFKYLDITAVS